MVRTNVLRWLRSNIALVSTVIVAFGIYFFRDFIISTWRCWWSYPDFRNGFGSSVGAIAGIVAFFLLRFLIERIRSSPQPIRRYSCAHDQNIGNPEEFEGELMHHHGRRVSQPAELEEIDRKGPVWEWNRDACGKDSGASVIYGPYTTDFSEPGEYEVVFVIRGVGLPAPREIQDDRVVLRLNVTRKTAVYIPTANGIAQGDTITTVARRFVRAGELACGSWRKIPVRFYVGGEGLEGLWEYVIIAFDGVSEKPNNLEALGINVRLFFDYVEVSRIRKMIVPWD